MDLQKAKWNFSRLRCNKNHLYIFTDNCDRTSGKIAIPDDSEYSKRFGKTGLMYPSSTSAIIRGLNNAYPITTKKSLKERWTDDDYAEFKKVIDDDIEHIKKACKKHKYTMIIFPKNGLLNTRIANITMERTPKLFIYTLKKEKELLNFEP